MGADDLKIQTVHIFVKTLRQVTITALAVLFLLIVDLCYNDWTGDRTSALNSEAAANFPTAYTLRSPFTSVGHCLMILIFLYIYVYLLIRIN